MERLSVPLEAGKISYIAGGKGKNLILLHSLNLSADSWKDIFKSLAQNYAVYALDMPGHGDSDKPPKNYLIEDYAQSVLQFMERLKIDHPIVCGNSVGALVALEMAVSCPQRVEKLILVGCPVRDAWERMERLAFSALNFDDQGNPRPLSLTDLKLTFANPTPELTGWFNQQRNKAGVWVKKTTIAISLYDPFPKLPLVKCPTLVLFGEGDVLREREKVLLQGVKGARNSLIKDAGHVPQMEQPEAFLREVSQFLRS